MQQLNLPSRIFMFAICSSIEYDLKKHILKHNEHINFTDEMKQKANIRINSKYDINEEELLNSLDLGDFVEIIKANPYEYNLNIDKSKILVKYFEKIIPIRNRVMHTKPLELGDRAILQEVIEDIEESLNFIDWNEIKETKRLLKEAPELLIERCKPIKYKDSYYHNLPESEFDDTGYIGRKKEIKEITDLILDDRFQIISIIGNGGIGKTAITVKILYELLDNPENKYDAIIWTSLKARTLSNGEFVDIQNSIKNISELMKDAEKQVVIDERNTASENLIEFMKNFKTLLVIDNLETINNNEINNFLKQIPRGSKILITSRTGLGELEYRYYLRGMNNKDGIKYFRELSKYYGIEYKKSDNYIQKLIEETLYSNPLSIKWYINGMYNGIKEDILQNKKEELIEFCMSNVYNKLTELQKSILGLFQIEDYEMSYAEIDFYLEEDETEIRRAINDLLPTSMIEIKNNNYQINMMAKDYLQLQVKIKDEFVQTITEKKKKLNDMLQNIKVNKQNDMLSPNCILYEYENKDNKIAAIYLNEALELSKNKEFEKSIDKIEKACSIAPNYFECYKIKAYLNAENKNITEAISNYNIAIKKCVRDIEYVTVYYAYSVFYTIVIPDNEKAYKLIVEAEKYMPDNVHILLQKTRALTRLGKFQDAEEIIESIEKIKINSDKTRNIKASVKANLYQKWAGVIEARDAEVKYSYLKKGIDSIEELEKLDVKTSSSLISLLKELAYMYYYEDSTKLLIYCLEKYINEIKAVKNNSMNTLKNIIESHKDDIDEEDYNIICKYTADYNRISKNIKEYNTGIIVKRSNSYGFINNAFNSMYFNIGPRIKEKLNVGDIVEFDTISSYKGKKAINIKKSKKTIKDYE